MNQSEHAPNGEGDTPESPASETELWAAIQEAKDDEVVRPEYDFEF